MTVATGALAGFAVTLAACPLVLRAVRHRIVDHPNDRSSHDEATPRGGGLAVMIGALVALALTPGLSNWRAPLIIVAAGFGLLGLVDDLRTLPALSRLAAQILIACAALPLLLRDLSGPLLWRAVFTFGVLLWLASYVNAFNFMDGINGISAAQVMVAGIAWYTIGRAEDVDVLVGGGLVIAACAAGFVPFNYPRAQMFLGDVGSYFLGGWLAVLVVVGLRSGLPVEAVVGPVSVALADTMSTILRRARRGEALHVAHRDHVYQRLVRLGWSHTLTTAFVALTVALSSLAGYATIDRSLPGRLVADVALVAVLAAYLCSPTIAGSASRRSAAVS